MSCHCNYSLSTNTPCISCVNVANIGATQAIEQKRIWRQVRTGSAIYTMNLSALTSAAERLASGSNVNWNQMSDRVLAANQREIHPTHGNSLRSTLTSDRPGAGSPGGCRREARFLCSLFESQESLEFENPNAADSLDPALWE